MLACLNCGHPFERSSRKSKAVTCSRHCANVLSWQNQETRAKRCDGIRAQKLTAEGQATIQAHNDRRWACDGERERASETMRRRWKDPIQGKVLLDAVTATNRSEKQSQKMSRIRLGNWATPEYREKMIAAQNRSHKTPAYREKMRVVLLARWASPEGRAAMIANKPKQRATDGTFGTRFVAAPKIKAQRAPELPNVRAPDPNKASRRIGL